MLYISDKNKFTLCRFLQTYVHFSNIICGCFGIRCFSTSLSSLFTQLCQQIAPLFIFRIVFFVLFGVCIISALYPWINSFGTLSALVNFANAKRLSEFGLWLKIDCIFICSKLENLYQDIFRAI